MVGAVYARRRASGYSVYSSRVLRCHKKSQIHSTISIEHPSAAWSFYAAERGAAADAAAAASTPATSAAGSKSSSSPSSMALSSASASVSASASHSALRRRKPGTREGGAPRPLAEIATWFQPPSSLRCSAVSRCSARACLGLGRRG